jgi:ankyrin repeat protein
MSDRSLPARPNLDQLRRQAKELRDAARAGEAAALARVRQRAAEHDPLTLDTALRVIAREYGFASWPSLKAELESRTRELAERVEAFLHASMSGLTMGRAARLLRDEPRIAGFDRRTAVVLGDEARVRAAIERDPGWAVRPDPGSGWPPLLGVCNSRWHRIEPARGAGMVAVARLLLDAGADPNTLVGRPGERSSCSALHAAAGHADHPAITELLLDRGAVVEEHTVYLAAFPSDHTCLRLLLAQPREVDISSALAAPISMGDAEGLRLLLEAGADPNRPVPADLFGESYTDQPPWTPLAAAIEFDCPPEMIELLLSHGAEPNTTGRTPYRLAVRRGNTRVAELLLRHGARDDSTPVDRFLDACARGDRVRAGHDQPAALTDEDRTAALLRAADQGAVEAVRLMLDLGFPVNRRGGPDGITPLHAAAGSGSAAVVRLLLSSGADVHAHDTRFDSPPIEWATVGSGERFGHDPNPDFPGTVQALIDAGASPNAWIDGKPPSPEVAELLRSHGITGPA